MGLIGVTGSGKTTMVDIILGLLEPQKGTLEVDGMIINKKFKVLATFNRLCTSTYLLS